MELRETIRTTSRPVQGMAILSVALLLVIYLFYPSYPTALGKSLGGWTWFACNAINGFLHGRLVPLVVAIMLWVAWRRAAEEEVKPSYFGMISLILGLVFFLAGMRIIQPRLALLGAPFLMIGVVHYLFGWRVMRHAVFPSFFLWFAIPTPGLESWITTQVQGLWPACYRFGTFLGMEMTMEGSTLILSKSKMSFAEG